MITQKLKCQQSIFLVEQAIMVKFQQLKLCHVKIQPCYLLHYKNSLLTFDLWNYQKHLSPFSTGPFIYYYPSVFTTTLHHSLLPIIIHYYHSAFATPHFPSPPLLPFPGVVQVRVKEVHGFHLLYMYLLIALLMLVFPLVIHIYESQYFIDQ